MWLLDKIRDSVGSLPQELAHFVGKTYGDACLHPQTTLSNNLNNNILTPDKIPEFCLPPTLFRREGSAWSPEGPPEYCFLGGAQPQETRENLRASPDNTTHVEAAGGGTGATAKTKRRKPPPFSAEGYDLAGVYESPNTRRKESLFHGKCPGYVFDRSSQGSAVQADKRTQQQVPRKTLSLQGLLPLGKSLSETGSTESGTSSSSCDSTPICSPYSTGPSLRLLADTTGDRVGADATTSSCPRVVKTREHRWRPRKEPSARPHHSLAAAAAAAATTASGPGAHLHTLVPPATFPLDLIHCQEPLEHQHALPLPGGGEVRLSTEHTPFPLSSSVTSSSSISSCCVTVRVRVVSVEGLVRDCADRRPLSCALSLCLVPGKLQVQKSATIRNCRSPVFNEDFFFTDLSEESLAVLELRVKVMDKSAPGTLRRGVVVAVVTKPLCQLLPL